MIDAVDVIRFVGPQTFGRGRDVVRAGLVEDAAWREDDGTVTATVTGSADDPYELRVETTLARGDFVRPVRSTCTCPLGGDCKHVAAALLTINARALAAASGARRVLPVETPPEPDWRHDLARLAGDDPQVAGPQGTPMGLQFELRDAVPSKLAARARAVGRALPSPSRPAASGSVSAPSRGATPATGCAGSSPGARSPTRSTGSGSRRSSTRGSCSSRRSTAPASSPGCRARATGCTSTTSRARSCGRCSARRRRSGSRS